MVKYAFYFILFASLRHTLSSPSNPFYTRDDAWYEEDRETEKCFIHVKIKSCHEATNVQLRLDGASSPFPLHELDLDIRGEGNEQDVCLPVPCREGQLMESMKLIATSPASSNVDIAVNPETLDASFRGLQEDRAKCFGGMPVTVACKKKPPESLDNAELMRLLYFQRIGTVGKVRSQNYITFDGYNNEYDQVLNFTCDSYQGLNSIQSRHSSTKKDRQYKIGCSDLQVPTDAGWFCYSKTPVNDYDEPFDFHCPQNFVMAGVYSEHNNTNEDRLWGFKCCRALNHNYVYLTKNCNNSGYINTLNEEFNYSVDDDRVFTGVHSYRDNCQEDRRWSITHCEYVSD